MQIESHYNHAWKKTVFVDYSDSMEKDVQSEIMEWLRAQDFIDFIFSTDVRIKRGRKFSGGKDRPAGLADICGNFVGGRSLYIECKDPMNKVRPIHQIQFLDDRRKRGAFACFACSTDELKLNLKNAGYCFFKDV